MTRFWNVTCKQGAWRGNIYILAPSEWEAGKQTEIALDQLGLPAEVVRVYQLPGIGYPPIQAASTSGESRCLLCDQPAREAPISRRTVISPKITVPFFGAVRILGEIRTKVCPHCGKPDQWQIDFGYIPENWFENQAQVVPFVGKRLIEDKEVKVP
ncbi:hypothetical protein Desaci_1444 [Desulfosporosinus acidiphilus SJ4]|uniref:Uncharacterized protein n=1 Tax=Desulfosporosinus acidiphilus (strain DSM 22704 / JCM 16185 / SJ4) TaxID=646529 RepID=I4D3T7_DESAJ|nr:hypothetical protein [Desulfosporosinus acidiphilus]AFM40461.1 hypothetical protein Desaci_1444 [Desulfosporosinus acidiphilus SJ4]